ncbi:MAG: helix-turn-helix transcriptional regulator [Dehalococcoidia bacterium]
MRTRGRPRHPETLTPRQQEVLALLRRGLTNEQIASALDISVDGVKYHVAEVLRRLDVRDRYEAALVEPGVERRSWLRGLLALPLIPKSKLSLVASTASVAAMAGVAAGIVLLILALAGTDHVGRDDELAARLASRELVAFKSGDETWRIGVFDSVAMRQIASFDAGHDSDTPSSAVIAGDRIVVNYGKRLDSHRIDGTDKLTVLEIDKGWLYDVASSPDGRLLALTVQTEDELCLPLPEGATSGPCGRTFADVTAVLVVDALTGDQVLRIPQSDARFGGLTGQAAHPVWRADGQAFVVTGSTQSEQPGNRATVYLDGRVIISTPLDYFVPNNGTRIATGEIEPCENLNLRRHELRIVDIETGHVLFATVSDDHRVFFPFEWSPDGTELLYFTQAYPRGPTDTSCEWDGATTEWSLLSVDGVVTNAVDPRDVHRRWFGTGAVEFECAQPTALLDGYCTEAQYASKAIVNGETVVEGTNIRILDRTSSY